jgi:hypothetical protein
MPPVRSINSARALATGRGGVMGPFWSMTMVENDTMEGI